MVWIHGGGFQAGLGVRAASRRRGLARKGVVVVTVNYRLGVFGFFAHPELTAESGAQGVGELRAAGSRGRAALGAGEHRAPSAAIRAT